MSATLSMTRTITPAEWELQKYLEMMLKARHTWYKGTEGTELKLAYFGTEDFLLQHGKWYTPRPLPSKYERGELHACFANSARCAVRYGLRYVEGYATTIIPQHHAWCVDDQDQVYEFTWDKPGEAYIGTEFNPMRVMHGAVFSNEHNFSIYKKKFRPEGRP